MILLTQIHPKAKVFNSMNQLPNIFISQGISRPVTIPKAIRTWLLQQALFTIAPNVTEKIQPVRGNQSSSPKIRQLIRDTVIFCVDLLDFC